ncbi:PREDICTED: protein maternal effect lethal 26-like isoform X2 [Wasmannia auropunctata]|uniref:protein maternal effect lethal 26-like isoform X2 n=1 Tax=Wasmannia auropunctata TaxID=64793 RepID=UPI0005EE2189|nr:PREDICTED: protein maternal effect lethal 26-like isoform X2 [Wasmannia auropunctata]
MKPPESLRAIKFYIRTNTPFTGSCTVINPPKSVLSKSVSGYIKDMTLLMEISDLDHIYTDTFIIRCKFEILHIVISNTIHMNLPSSTVYPKDETSEDSTFNQFEPKNVNSIKFIIDKEQYVISKKLLYATNSSYFKNMCLTHNKDEKELTNELKRNNEVQAFKYLLLFILTGSIEEIQDNYCMLEQLLIIANKYDVSALKLTCKHYLLRHITIENAMKLVQLAFSSNAKYLESHSATFFKLYKNDIINTKEFRDLLPEDSDKIMELIENSRRCETSTPNFLFTSICEKY